MTFAYVMLKGEKEYPTKLTKVFKNSGGAMK